MIKRTLEISREGAHLALRDGQLVLRRGSDTLGSVPCEDVGLVVVDHPAASFTHRALTGLAEHGAVVLLCGDNHLPVALLLPLADHTEVVWRLDDQLAASLPLRKRLWRQIVRAKILAQADNLDPKSPTRRRLLALAREVRSGDAGGAEAHAARLYWAAWIVESPDDERPDHLKDHPPDHDAPGPLRAAPSPEADLARFRRDTEGDGLNALLNYGYAVLRAAVARAVVAAGLHPTLGLQHRHRGNPFCLADDLMEPLRPLVDRRALRLWWNDQRTLDQPAKAVLLDVLTEEVRVGDDRGPLLVALHRYTASLVRCLRRESDRLLTPRRVPSS